MQKKMVVYLSVLFLINVNLYAAVNILVVQSRDEYLSNVAAKFERELSGPFNIVKLKKVRDTTEIAEIFPELNPKAIIILEKHSKSTSLYWFREYIRSHANQFSRAAFVFVKDFFVDQSEIFADNATAISYLPPISLGVERLQGELHKEIRSIGVIHSRSMRKMIIDNSASCVLSGISLVMKPVPDRNDPAFVTTLTDALNATRKQKVDALWIIEDENVVQLQLAQEIWVPFIQKNGIPVIVNSEAYMADPWKLGSVCYVPDPQLVSSQIAENIRKLQNENWIVSSPSINPLECYSKQLKTVALSRRVAVSKPQEQSVEGAKHTTVSLKDTVQSTSLSASIPLTPVSSTESDSTPEKIEPEVKRPSLPVASSNQPNNEPARISSTASQNAKKTAKPQEVSLNKQVKVDSRKKPPEPHVKPSAVEQVIPGDRDQQTSLGNVLKIITINSAHAAVRKLSDPSSVVIGWALKGQQFPVYEETGDNLKILFFNTPGWITERDAKIIEDTTLTSSKRPVNVKGNLLVILLVALNIAFAAALVAFLLVKKPFSRFEK
jgi:hypothetical protein